MSEHWGAPSDPRRQPDGDGYGEGGYGGAGYGDDGYGGQWQQPRQQQQPQQPQPQPQRPDPYAPTSDPYAQHQDPYGQGQYPYAQQPDPYAQRQDSYGQRQDSYAQRQDSYGQAQDPYAQRQDSYEQRQDYARQPDAYGRQQDSYGRQSETDTYGERQDPYDRRQQQPARQDPSTRQDPPARQNPAARQEGYGPQQPATPYLERNPYRELSQTSLDRAATRPRTQDYPSRADGYGGSFDEERGGGSSRSRRPPVKESNGTAVAGAVLFFIPLVGLGLSIIGLALAKSRGGAGRTAGVVGIVLSLLVYAGGGLGVYELLHSTAADPACLSAEADVARLSTTLSTDSAALDTASKSGNKTQFTTAANKFVGDAQSLESQLAAAQSKATHSDVRSAIGTFDTDLNSFVTGMHQALSGDTSNESATTQAVDRLQSDGDSVDNLCGNMANG